MISHTSLIAQAFDLPMPELKPVPLQDERDAVTGEILTMGYHVHDAMKSSYNDWWMFRGTDQGFIGVDTLRCFEAFKPQKKIMIGAKSLAVFGGVGYQPLISDESAKEQCRPWWSQLVRDVWDRHRGEPCVIILTTDTKTRLFNRPHVQSGILSRFTPVALYDPSGPIDTTIRVDWPEFLNDLDFVEYLLSEGYWISAVRMCLWKQRNLTSFKKTAENERRMGRIREKEYFPIISIIARTHLKENMTQTKEKIICQKIPRRTPPEQPESLPQKSKQLTLF